MDKQECKKPLDRINAEKYFGCEVSDELWEEFRLAQGEGSTSVGAVIEDKQKAISVS